MLFASRVQAGVLICNEIQTKILGIQIISKGGPGGAYHTKITGQIYSCFLKLLDIKCLSDVCIHYFSVRFTVISIFF